MDLSISYSKVMYKVSITVQKYDMQLNTGIQLHQKHLVKCNRYHHIDGNTKGGTSECNIVLRYFCTVQPLILSLMQTRYRTRENNTNLYPVTSKDPEDIILKTKKEARASRIPLPATSTSELNHREKSK
jgi:hypothetical protein